jgi:hypothetical protein
MQYFLYIQSMTAPRKAWRNETGKKVAFKNGSPINHLLCEDQSESQYLLNVPFQGIREPIAPLYSKGASEPEVLSYIEPTRKSRQRKRLCFDGNPQVSTNLKGTRTNLRQSYMHRNGSIFIRAFGWRAPGRSAIKRPSETDQKPR